MNAEERPVPAPYDPTPYNEGRRARRDGRGPHDDPYVADMWWRKCWREGWLDEERSIHASKGQ